MLQHNGPPPPPMTMIHEDEGPPSDFEIAKRVARRLWGFSDAAISFAGSSESTREQFVAWVKFNLRQFEKKGQTTETVVVRARSGTHPRTRGKPHCPPGFSYWLRRGRSICCLIVAFCFCFFRRESRVCDTPWHHLAKSFGWCGPFARLGHGREPAGTTAGHNFSHFAPRCNLALLVVRPELVD